MTETILVEAVTRRSAVQKMTVALDAWQGLWGASGWGSKHAQGNRGSGRARKLSRALNHRWSIDPATLSCPVWIHQCARRNDFSQRSLVMSRALILIAAPSLVVISLALSADAQQLPDVTPGMVEMTEPPTPAPAGFNNRTNGFAEQAQFDRDPTTGNFIEPPGGSLIHQRAIRAEIQEHVRPEDNVRTLRMSTNTLGNGFVEVIQDRTIIDICDAQPREMQGLPIIVPVAVAVKTVADGEPDEFEFVLRIGRFGWKAQEASLLNFSANAYLNEMGITSPLQPNENRSNGRDVSQFDEVADPEDEAQPKPNLSTPKPTKPDDFLHPFGEDVEAFARFMRSTKVPPRDFALTELDIEKDVAGEKIFSD